MGKGEQNKQTKKKKTIPILAEPNRLPFKTPFLATKSNERGEREK
jgi:hypothetical protein